MDSHRPHYPDDIVRGLGSKDPYHHHLDDIARGSTENTRGHQAMDSHHPRYPDDIARELGAKDSHHHHPDDVARGLGTKESSLATLTN